MNLRHKAVSVTALALLIPLSAVLVGTAFADSEHSGNKQGDDNEKYMTSSSQNGSTTQAIMRGDSDNEGHKSGGSAKVSLQINPSGQVQIDGAVVSAISGGSSSGTLSVSIFGWSLTVNAAGAKILPQNGGSATLADLKVGDSIGVQGTINQSTGVITASKVMDHSLQSASGQSANSNQIQRLMAQIAELQRRLQMLLGATTTPPVADTTPPAISAISTSGIASTTATVNWTTNEAATSKVYFGTVSPLDLASASVVMSTALVINHSSNLTGLAASTTIFYVVESRDAANNVATSSSQSFMTSN